MSENILTPPTKNEPRRGLSWLHVLFTGIVLFVVSTVVMFLTSNPNLFPTVILMHERYGLVKHTRDQAMRSARDVASCA